MAIQYVKSADVGKDRYEWLENHPEIGFAELVRKAIDEKRGEEGKGGLKWSATMNSKKPATDW
jgi:hypothetical protein